MLKQYLSRLAWATVLGTCSLAASAASVESVDPAAQPAPALNDTGMTLCVVFDEQQEQWVYTPKCQGTGQDGAYGRDVTARANKDGRVGFSFVKLDPNGEKLPRDASSWRCVLDKTTGLVWEVKTADGSLFDYRNRYTHIGDGRASDTSSFVDAVNAQGLCGASDWRLPTRGELESLLDYSQAGFGPMVDTDWFPNSLGTLHWSSTGSAVNGGGPGYWWAVNFLAGNTMWRNGEFDADPVRLVRSGTKAPAKRWKVRGDAGSEVLDRQTQLIWRRCAEGRGWNGSTCSGSGTIVLTGHDATEHALAEAARTGKPWRVPNIKELSALVDTKTNFPAIDRTPFPAFEADLYHSGTAWTQNPVYTWRVAFGRGEITTDFWGGRLLLVRDAE